MLDLWRTCLRRCGTKYDPGKHTSGTEIKAITYSNMQILEAEQRCDIYVIVDI